jgi:ubiquinone/menaquinone biosynthesis C-methylase UbiE
MNRKQIETMGTDAIKRYLDSQKNWITRLYAKRQLTFVGERPDWFAGEDVLDVGCGRGVLEASFHDYSRSFTSCDIVDTNFYGIDVKLCSAECLLFCNNEFDSVFMLGVIEHVEMPDLAVRESRRVLRAGGKLIISIPNGLVWWLMRLIKPWLPEHLRKHARFGQKQLYQLMDGWTLLSRRPIIPGLFWLYEFEVKE